MGQRPSRAEKVLHPCWRISICIGSKQFTRSDGPGRWANAKLVRHADDFIGSGTLSIPAADRLDRRIASRRRVMELAPRCRSKLFAVLVPGQGGGSNPALCRPLARRRALNQHRHYAFTPRAWPPFALNSLTSGNTDRRAVQLLTQVITHTRAFNPGRGSLARSQLAPRRPSRQGEPFNL